MSAAQTQQPVTASFHPLNLPSFWQEGVGEWVQAVSKQEIRPQPAPYQQARQHDGRIQIVGSDCKGSNPSSLPVSSGTPGKLINLSVPPFSHQPSEA